MYIDALSLIPKYSSLAIKYRDICDLKVKFLERSIERAAAKFLSKFSLDLSKGVIWVKSFQWETSAKRTSPRLKLIVS